MVNPERQIYSPDTSLLIPTYKEPERSPFVVVGQTRKVLDLYKIGFPDFSKGIEYLQQYTLPYLHSAETNCDIIFDKFGAYKKNADPESREAASHAYTIFTWLTDMTAVPGTCLRYGYSREGILRAPINKAKYLSRIREMKITLAKIASGIIRPNTNPGRETGYFRTDVFFTVGESLVKTSKLEPGEKEVREKYEEDWKKMKRLLNDIDFSTIQ